MEFDLGKRELRVLHDGPVDDIAGRLGRVGLGARLVSTAAIASTDRVPGAPDAARGADEARVLRWLLAINAVMFVLEIAAGWLGQSTGLIADSLDMLADAAVYGLALYAVGRNAEPQAAGSPRVRVACSWRWRSGRCPRSRAGSSSAASPSRR